MWCFLLLALVMGRQARGSELDGAASWTCFFTGDMECPQIDEQRREPGCQVACHSKTMGVRCERAQQKCASYNGCVDFKLNKEATWATLVAARLRRGVSLTAAAPAAPARRNAAAALLDCGQLDELPELPGCQVRCKSARCARAERRCHLLSQCGGLDRHFSAHGDGYASLLRTNAAASAKQVEEELHCASSLHNVGKDRSRPLCTAASTLCVVIAKPDVPREFTANLHWSPHCVKRCNQNISLCLMKTIF